MNIKVSIDPARRFITAVIEGEIDLQFAHEARHRVTSHPMHNAAYAILYDLRKARYARSMLESQALAESMTKTYPENEEKGPVAVVVGDDLTYGALRQYAAFVEMRGRRLEIFRDCVEAEVWLGVKKAEKKAAAG